MGEINLDPKVNLTLQMTRVLLEERETRHLQKKDRSSEHKRLRDLMRKTGEEQCRYGKKDAICKAVFSSLSAATNIGAAGATYMHTKTKVEGQPDLKDSINQIASAVNSVLNAVQQLPSAHFVAAQQAAQLKQSLVSDNIETSRQDKMNVDQGAQATDSALQQILQAQRELNRASSTSQAG